MKVKVSVPKPVAKMLERLVETGLYGRNVEECAFRLMGDALQRHLSDGGLLHDEFVAFPRLRNEARTTKGTSHGD